MGRAVLIGCLLALLAGALVIAFAGWNLEQDVQMPVGAYVALGLGVAFSLLFGIGLMALVFYSNRKGYDQAAHEAWPEGDRLHGDETRPPPSG